MRPRSLQGLPDRASAGVGSAPHVTMPFLTLTRDELSLLRAIHEADRDRGGLARTELTDEEAATCDALVLRGLAEAIAEFGEAPDGEEDERDAGGAWCYRVTGRGVEALGDAGHR